MIKVKQDKSLGSGLTAAVYEAFIQNDNHVHFAYKELNTTETKLLYVDPQLCNKCRCLPYIYINDQSWMMMEYMTGDSLHSKIRNFSYYTIMDYDSMINVTVGVLNCLKELHNVKLDYIDISEGNVNIKIEQNSPTEIRFYDHGGIAIMNAINSKPFVAVRHRSVSAIMNEKREFCCSLLPDGNKWQQDDSVCSVLFMALSMIIYPPWHSHIINGNINVGNYTLIDKLRQNSIVIASNRGNSHVYDQSNEKQYDRIAKDIIKYRVFYNIILTLFKDNDWATIENKIKNNADYYVYTLSNYFGQINNNTTELTYYVALICVLIIWSTARIKTNSNVRDIDFVISMLEQSRRRVPTYDWKIFSTQTKKSAYKLGNPDIIYSEI